MFLCTRVCVCVLKKRIPAMTSAKQLLRLIIPVGVIRLSPYNLQINNEPFRKMPIVLGVGVPANSFQGQINTCSEI